MNNSEQTNENFVVVLQGLPVTITNQYILNCLKARDFEVIKVCRRNNSHNKPTREVTVQLSKPQNYIIGLNCCLGFRIKIKKLEDYFSSVKRGAVPKTGKAGKQSATHVTVVIRGVPVGIPEKVILENLRNMSFKPIVVHRMVRQIKRSDLDIPVIIVIVPNNERYIFELTCLLGFRVTVEAFNRKHYNLMQCSKCLNFGHSSKYCAEFQKYDSSRSGEIKKDKVESTLEVTLEEIPTDFNIHTIEKDLCAKGFNPISIRRIRKREKGLTTCLIIIPNDEKRILMLTCCLGLTVKVQKYVPELYEVLWCKICENFECNLSAHHEKPIDLINLVNDANASNKNNNMEKSGIEFLQNYKDLQVKLKQVSNNSPLNIPKEFVSSKEELFQDRLSSLRNDSSILEVVQEQVYNDNVVEPLHGKDECTCTIENSVNKPFLTKELSQEKVILDADSKYDDDDSTSVLMKDMTDDLIRSLKVHLELIQKTERAKTVLERSTISEGVSNVIDTIQETLSEASRMVGALEVLLATSEDNPAMHNSIRFNTLYEIAAKVVHTLHSTTVTLNVMHSGIIGIQNTSSAASDSIIRSLVETTEDYMKKISANGN